MKNIKWDAYQIFLAVARHGGLSGAAEMLGVSAATIGRHMLEFEQSVGRSLFVRGSTGYGLTGDGQALFDELLAMEAASRRVENWRAETGSMTTVRIAAGSWVARLMAQNFSAIATARDSFQIAFHISEHRAQLVHRENDIGIRAVPPTESGLAAIRTGDVAYCAYQARNMAPAHKDRWIAVEDDLAVSAYLRWPHQYRAGQIVVTVDRAHALRDMILAGAGNAVLPCFVGDLDPQLERHGDVMTDIGHDQWIVANNDDRHRRDIRIVLDRVSGLLKRHADLFAGRRPATSRY